MKQEEKNDQTVAMQIQLKGFFGEVALLCRKLGNNITAKDCVKRRKPM